MKIQTASPLLKCFWWLFIAYNPKAPPDMAQHHSCDLLSVAFNSSTLLNISKSLQETKLSHTWISLCLWIPCVWMLSSRNNTLILPGRAQSTTPVKPNFLQGCSTVHFPKLQYVLYIYFSKCYNFLAIEAFEYKVFIYSSPPFPTTSLCAVSVTHH